MNTGAIRVFNLPLMPTNPHRLAQVFHRGLLLTKLSIPGFLGVLHPNTVNAGLNSCLDAVPIPVTISFTRSIRNHLLFCLDTLLFKAERTLLSIIAAMEWTICVITFYCHVSLSLSSTFSQLRQNLLSTIHL
jgi:hypothetical protein